MRLGADLSIDLPVDSHSWDEEEALKNIFVLSWAIPRACCGSPHPSAFPHSSLQTSLYIIIVNILRKPSKGLKVWAYKISEINASNKYSRGIRQGKTLCILY